MARKIQVSQVSDLSEQPADETVSFSLDGREYEIDLSAEEAARMRSELAPYTGCARRARPPGRRPARAPRKPARDDLPSIREYARERGHRIGERGRVPAMIVAEYDMLKGYEIRR